MLTSKEHLNNIVLILDEMLILKQHSNNMLKQSDFQTAFEHYV